METNKNKITDVLGLAPYGDAIKIAVEKGFEGASALLSRVCLPAAEELGLWYRDKVRFWRLNHVIKILEKAEGKMTFEGGELKVHPRIIHEVLEEGSWCEDELLQEMWAGLLSISSTTGTPSDSHLLYINKLKQITSTQARIIEHIGRSSRVGLTSTSLVVGIDFEMATEELLRLTGIDDIYQLDAELDSLRALELIDQDSGFVAFAQGSHPVKANVTPTAFLLHLYAKIQGFKGAIPDFYSDRLTKLDAIGLPLEADVAKDLTISKQAL